MIDSSWDGKRARARMYGRVPPRPTARRVMHKFKIGQQLFPARSVGLNVLNSAYVIIKRLPELDGEFQYQIKCVANPDERIVRESQLRPSPWRSPGRRVAS
jgi:hypothetical protein